MVKTTAELQLELLALVRSQAEDDRRIRVRHRGRVVNGVDFDRLPSRDLGALVLLEGRTQHYDARHAGHVCPRCGAQAGGDVCLVCEGGGEGRTLRGRKNPDAGGPTSYRGTGRFKGGKGK